jgi:hypothetical protein
MSVLIGILIALNVMLGWLVFVHQTKIEKLDKNQAIMLGYFDTINKNETTLRDDLQKLYHEFRNTKEKAKASRPIGPQAKESV